MEIVTPIFSTLRWQDMVDILLNSYILFRLYALFRGTNVIRVVAGIALLWIIQRLAVTLGLIVTSWAIQGIIAAAALIIIIVFRNEIRNVLQAKNLRAILWGFPQRDRYTPTEILVEGVYSLAAKKTGALIVLPGREDLSDYMQGGVTWNGEVSKEMLTTIFWKDSPVHDGAALIEGRRVARVGAVLPLSTQEDLPAHYGTRHRAAIGLAGATDALVILVSEESGTIMVAKGEKIWPVKNRDMLEHTIREQVGYGNRVWRGLVREQMELGMVALFCLLSVSTVWFVFARGKEALATFEIPVEYTNRDSRMEIIDTSANSVSVDVSGSGALIKSIRTEQINVKLNLSNAGIGANSYTITGESVAMPPGVLLKKVDPEVIVVTLDIPVAKEIDIQVDWQGKLLDNLILDRVELIPGKIKVVGGSHLLENLETIYTEKVFLDSIQQSGETKANLVLRPASLTLADNQGMAVLIRYRVVARLPAVH